MRFSVAPLAPTVSAATSDGEAPAGGLPGPGALGDTTPRTPDGGVGRRGIARLEPAGIAKSAGLSVEHLPGPEPFPAPLEGGPSSEATAPASLRVVQRPQSSSRTGEPAAILLAEVLIPFLVVLSSHLALPRFAAMYWEIAASVTPSRPATSRWVRPRPTSSRASSRRRAGRTYHTMASQGVFAERSIRWERGGRGYIPFDGLNNR